MPNEVNNLIRLIDAICVAWDNQNYYPEFENGVLVSTHCNQFVCEVAHGVGCEDFFHPITHQPMIADDIIQKMTEFSKPNGPWTEIKVAGYDPQSMANQLRSIQIWANQGFLTIAGATASDLKSAHGHVCIVRPGNLKSSGKWGDVPVVANVGKEMFIGRAKSGPMKGEPVGVNEAFIQLPRFWSWKG